MYDEIRRSQIITTFGVGAISDFRNYSGVLKSPEAWNPMVLEYIENEQRIDDPRLASFLGVEYFLSPPPKSEQGPKLPFTLFPRMLYCPSCKILKDVKYWFKQSNIISYQLICTCKSKDRKKRFTRLLPSRFIVICPKGHIDDFPYDNWVHQYQECKKSNQYDYQSEFEYHAIGGGASLEDIKIKCKNCRKTRSMSGALNNNYHKHYKCNGYRPELHNKTPYYEKCGVDNMNVKFVLRNASNVYFPSIFSSLLIPPFSRELSIKIQSLTSFKYLRQKYSEDPNSPLYKPIFNDCIQEATRLFEVSVEKVKYLIDELLNINIKSKNIDDYKMSEFNAFLDPSSSDENFKVENIKVDKLINYKIDKIIRCDRLREVRVFSGYTRIKPYDKNLINLEESDDFKHKQVTVAPVIIVSKSKPGWMLGVELFGEGVFLSFKDDIFESISYNDKFVKERISIIKTNKNSYENETGFILPDINARFLAIHTLSHILIKRIAFESGYGLPSLRERIYCNTINKSPSKLMNGLLIYTADTDVEGTLGGLSRLSEDDKLYDLIIDSMEEAEWCSSDPVCRESKGQGIGSLNISACHSCCLLPETCCEYGNKFLDRGIMESFFKYE